METELMSQSEIAQLARVTKPAVMAWRRRYDDYPAPVARGDGQPLFPADAVVNWLLRTGLGRVDAETLRAEQSLHTLSAYAGQHGARRTVTTLGAALCLRYLAGQPLPADPLPLARRLDPDDEFLLTEMADAPEPVSLPRIVEQLIEGAFTPGRASQLLLDSASRLGWPELAADALTTELVTLLRRITDLPGRLRTQRTVTIADVFAGPGDLLAALADGHDPATLRISATSADPSMVRLIRRQLLLAELPEFQFDVLDNGLNEEFADADLIVTRLPYQPGEVRDALTDLDRIEALADLLGPGRTAVVVGPASSLVEELRHASAVSRRAELLGSGIVEAVVLLPGGVYPARPGYPAALWVLTRDPIAAARGRVLLSDLSGTTLNPPTVDAAADDIRLWRAEGYRRDGHDPHTGRIVSLESLDLRRGAALRLPGPPSVTLRADLAADRPALIDECERRLADAEHDARQYVEQHGSLNSGAIQQDGEPPKEISIGGLLKARRLRKLPGHRLKSGHVTPQGHYRVIGAVDLTENGPRRWIDRLTLAEYPHAALTERGDLVVTLVPHWSVWLDVEGSSVIEYPACGLRITAGDALSPLVLKELLDTARQTTRSPGAVRAGQLRIVTIPDLDPTETSRLDRLLQPIAERERLLERQVDLLAELRRLTVAGFADGTLTTDSTMYGPNPE